MMKKVMSKEENLLQFKEEQMKLEKAMIIEEEFEETQKIQHKSFYL